MIKIIQFVSTLDIKSGVMNVIMNYYRNIDRKNYQFTFIYFLDSDKTYINEIMHLGGKVHKISKPSMSNKWVKQMKEILSQNNFEIFHNHEVYLSSMLRIISKKAGIKRFIIHAHATEYSDKWLKSIRNRILCIPIQYMNVEKLACSKAAADFLYGYGNYDCILNNAIDVKKYRFNSVIREELRKKYKISDETLVVGHIGRMVQQKNQIFLLKIFKELLLMQKSKLVFIGEGPLKKEIIAFTKDEGMEEDIIFLKERTDINELLNMMDVFLLPSLYEGLPVVCIEAQANGLPCIISDRITEEVILSDLCRRISLDSSINLWVDIIVTLYKKQNYEKRYEGKKCIENACFNIKKEVKKLEIYYKPID